MTSARMSPDIGDVDRGGPMGTARRTDTVSTRGEAAERLVVDRLRATQDPEA